jgi:hypothetical protein
MPPQQFQRLFDFLRDGFDFGAHEAASLSGASLTLQGF